MKGELSEDGPGTLGRLCGQTQHLRQEVRHSPWQPHRPPSILQLVSVLGEQMDHAWLYRGPGTSVPVLGDEEPLWVDETLWAHRCLSGAGQTLMPEPAWHVHLCAAGAGSVVTPS